ncbi:MAG: hypothetical protein HIU82_02040 [Proteobacteria bacterium]|nr:hypothetical protein [Pseudomonadota bacterium]
MQIDLAPAVTALAPLALAAFTAAIPYGLVLARRAIGLRLTAHQVAVVTGAADAGAKAAYGFLVANGASYADVPVRNAAIAVGANHMLASVAPALRALNLTPEHVSAMVSARLGGLLAADPTVGVTAPAAVKPAAPVAAAA